MIIITNAFSINMLSKTSVVSIAQRSVAEVKHIIKDGFRSAIGHTDTAVVVSSILNVGVETNRCNVTLDGNTLIVAQFTGTRLPEGATKLPEGATIKFWEVNII